MHITGKISSIYKEEKTKGRNKKVGKEYLRRIKMEEAKVKEELRKREGINQGNASN